MIVQFGTAGKRINSTKIPAVPVEYDAVLKAPSSIENPVLDIAAFLPQAATAYIPNFGNRYYFVQDIQSVTNDIWRYYLTVDPLASHKNKILANTVCVERSQNLYSDLLKDECATHQDTTPNTLTTTTAITGFNAGGVYILQTIAPGVSGSIAAGNAVYACTVNVIKGLMDTLFDTTFYGSGTIDDTVKTYFNPFQFITSCRWFPFLMSPGTPENIKFGWWIDTAHSASPVTSNNLEFTADIIMPARLDWTDCDPAWTRFNLYVPGFGDLEIDPCWSGDTLTVKIYPDLLTGQATLRIVNSGGDLVMGAVGQLGVDIQLTQLSSDVSNIGSTLFNTLTMPGSKGNVTVQDVFSNNAAYNQGTADVFNAMMGAFDLIPIVGRGVKESIANSMQPAPASVGANGNMAFIKNNLSCVLTRKKYSIINNDLLDVYGKPYRRNALLSRCTGFTKCNNASIDIAGATAKEIQMINNLLEGGVWIE